MWLRRNHQCGGAARALLEDAAATEVVARYLAAADVDELHARLAAGHLLLVARHPYAVDIDEADRAVVRSGVARVRRDDPVPAPLIYEGHDIDRQRTLL